MYGRNRMRIVRELMPNGMPLVVQGVLDENDEIGPESIEVYPLIRPASSDLDEDAIPESFLLSKVFVLPRLPVSMGKLAQRLAKRLSNTESYEDS